MRSPGHCQGEAWSGPLPHVGHARQVDSILDHLDQRCRCHIELQSPDQDEPGEVVHHRHHDVLYSVRLKLTTAICSQSLKGMVTCLCPRTLHVK